MDSSCPFPVGTTITWLPAWQPVAMWQGSSQGWTIAVHSLLHHCNMLVIINREVKRTLPAVILDQCIFALQRYIRSGD
eukprot:c29928_g1_i1 orf=847-1080(+)